MDGVLDRILLLDPMWAGMALGLVLILRTPWIGIGKQ